LAGANSNVVKSHSIVLVQDVATSAVAGNILGSCVVSAFVARGIGLLNRASGHGDNIGLRSAALAVNSCLVGIGRAGTSAVLRVKAQRADGVEEVSVST
jgi:hypothetical protein